MVMNNQYCEKHHLLYELIIVVASVILSPNNAYFLVFFFRSIRSTYITRWKNETTVISKVIRRC